MGGPTGLSTIHAPEQHDLDEIDGIHIVLQKGQHKRWRLEACARKQRSINSKQQFAAVVKECVAINLIPSPHEFWRQAPDDPWEPYSKEIQAWTPSKARQRAAF